MREETGVRVPVTKARLIGVDRPVAQEGGDQKSAFTGAGALVPPYDPETLCYWFEHSSALRPNVDAMKAGIEGHGNRLEAVIDLRAKGADEAISAALMTRAFNEAGGDDFDDPFAEPSEDEIATERARLARRMRLERSRLESWIKHAAYEGSFVGLREKLREDLEVTGNAYVEVLRNRRGAISRLRYVPSYLCRMMPLGEEFVEVEELEQTSAISYESIKIERRLRRFVQLDEVSGSYVFFREFGDPRVLSAQTGRFFGDEETLRREEPSSRRATEMIHFKIHSSRSPYGIPRWIASIPEVKGKRAAAEVNFFLFDNKSVPPLAVCISGGKLAEGADTKIEKFISEDLKGVENWSKILLIEAESSGSSGTAPKIEFHRLSKEITDDGLFLKYDSRAALTIGAQWRIPRILRGDTDDFNRATAEAALRMAEDLVFGPERREFDAWMNREILPALGIYTISFVSLSPSSRDPEVLATLLERLAKVGGLVPRDVRELASDVFNRELAPIPAAWQDAPVAFTLGGIQTGKAPSLEEEAEKVVDLRDRLANRAGSLAEVRAQLARESIGGGELRVDVTRELLESLVERR